MNEIDLIPADYRQHLRLRRFARLYLVALAGLVLVIVLAKSSLTRAIQNERETIERLRKAEVQLLNRKDRYDELRQRQSDLHQRLTVLETLRGGPPVSLMFRAIDRSINPAVWFLEWKFMRDTTQRPLQQNATGKAGYFLMVDENEQPNEKEPLQSSTSMEIRGQAMSHSDLAEFVYNLLLQPGIRDVHLHQTATRRYSATQVIEYQMTVEVDKDTEAP